VFGITQGEQFMIRTIIADDEALARQRIRRLLSIDPDFVIVQECVSGSQTVEAVNRLRPDLLFMDVQMPELDGFAVLRGIQSDRMPVVVFTTAYDQYAIQAFEQQALDYLLKPFDEARFYKAVQRAKREVTNAAARVTPSAQAPQSRIAIRSRGRIVVLEVEDIDFVEAAANYIRIHSGTETHLLREPIGSFESKLDRGRFARIHRSTIVNTDRIKELLPCPNGEFIVVLRNGKELSLSRTFRDRINPFLEGAAMRRPVQEGGSFYGARG
jgi:two-component system, LytTR family, response regulator